MNDSDRSNGTRGSPLRAPVRPVLSPLRRKLSTNALAVRLRGRALLLARAAWLTIAALASALFVASLWPQVRQLRGACPPGVCVQGHMPPALAQAYAALHLSVSFYGWYTLGLNVVFALGCVTVAMLLFWRRSFDPFALYVSLALLVFGTISFTAAPADQLVAAIPGLWLLVALLQFFGVAAFGVVGYIFPDGRFVPRWTLLATVAEALWFLPAYLFPGSALDYNTLPEVPFFGGWTGFWAAVCVAQVYRYRRVSTPAQRLQTKWVVCGVVGAAIGYIGGLLVLHLIPGPVPTSPEAVLAVLAGHTLIIGGFLLIPVSLGIAMLRYHLFDVDLIIRQTLIYTALVATLALLYEGGVLLVEQVLLTFTGQTNLPAEVAVAFGVGALAEPAHRRVERSISRVFYTRKYEAERRIEAFSRQVRRELGLTTVPERLEDAVETRWEHIRLGDTDHKELAERSVWLAPAGPASHYGTPAHPIPPPAP